MNKVVLVGRLTAEPDVRYTTNGEPMAIARYTLAVDRKYSQNSDKKADFIRCVCFKRAAEFVEKYFHKGTKIIVEGRIQTDSYQDKDTGKMVYTTEIIVENQEFAESKSSAQENGVITTPGQQTFTQPSSDDGFMNIPDNVDDSGLPFNF